MISKELMLQSKCFIWHWNTHIEDRQMLFHVNNNAHSRAKGSLNKASGVVAGISDMIYICPLGLVAFIEFKVGEGKQNREQISFEGKLRERGHSYFIIRSFEEFKELITKLKSYAK